MRKCLLGIVFIAGAVLAPISRAAEFAESVVAYTPGVGFATEFGTGLPFTISSSALGEPSRVTPGTFGGPVDPFNPPYLRDQLVSIGAGGSLTVHFANPIRNDAANPFGIDFTIFGNSGLTITNGDFSGGGITDGSMFGAAAFASTRISVSADNLEYFTLAPGLAPVFDGYFPTDGAGDFGMAVNPNAANEAALNGRGLAGLRAIYGGSAGGAGYDIGWAQNSAGNFVALNSISYIRVDVLSGAAEIDGFSVAPEPATWTLLALGGAAGWFFRKRRQ